MEHFITYFNLVCTIISMWLFLWAVYFSKNIFIKAAHRDVRQILTPEIKKYERKMRFKLVLKFGLAVILLAFSIGRIDAGFLYINNLDMALWVAVSLLVLFISYIDFNTASPENEN